MSKRRRPPLVLFNLSFLDIMFCGFGAVVLLVLIIHSSIKAENRQYTEVLHREIKQKEIQLLAAEKHKQELITSLENNNNESQALQTEIDSILNRSKALNNNNSQLLDNSNAQRKTVESLKQQLKQTEKNSQLSAEQEARSAENKVLKFQGDGQRQYLSGMNMGGKHIVIFLDVSASMLDTTIVNIIRRRNMSESERRHSKKWQRAIKTVHWLVSNLALDSNLQIITFNTEAESLLDEDGLNWLKVKNKVNLNKLMTKLDSKIPSGGTSLEAAFKLLKKMQPSADNVFLLTDGLPTQGSSAKGITKVTGAERAELFTKAVKLIPEGVSVNTILYPMEGDPMAAVLYWKLAVDTRGSFLTPATDWP